MAITVLNPSADIGGGGDVLDTNLRTSAYEHSFIAFITGSVTGTLSSATLRLYYDDADVVDHAVHASSHASYTEGGLVPTPVNSGFVTVGALGVVINQGQGWIEFDVTAYVQGEMAGNNVPVFELSNSASGWKDYHSRQGFNKPELVIETAGVSADVSASPSSGTAPLTVVFDASGSVSEGGTITGYSWDFGDGGSGVGVAPAHNYTGSGSYTATVTVTDDNGESDTASVNIDVNAAPVASFTAIPQGVSYTLSPEITNLIGYSERLDQWSPVRCSVQTDLALSPYGGSTADKLIEDTSASTHYCSTAVDLISGQVYTYTVYASLADARRLQLRAAIVDDQAATFDLSAGSFVIASGSPAATIVDAGSGWYRCSITFTSDITASVSMQLRIDNGSTQNYAGDGVSGVYVVGAQVVQSSQSQDYVPTPSADPVTRPLGAIVSTPPATVNFDAGASADADGSISSYAWDFGDGNSDTGSTASHAYSTPGSYTATLTVTDNDGATSVQEKTIIVGALPVASFTLDASSGDVPHTVNVDGSGSSDADGTIEAYSWDFGDGTVKSGATASHTYNSTGAYTLTLTVTDDSGATHSTSQSVTVTAPPNAVISADKIAGAAPLSVNFDGSGSSDPDGSISSYAWDFGDGDSDTGATVQHTFSAGSHTVTLTVTDNDGRTGTATQQITITEPPNASFTATPTTGDAPLEVTFDGSNSSDPDGSISSYSWDFGNGQSATGNPVAYTYPAGGNFTATLTVTDNAGATDSASQSIAINSPPQAFFTASAVSGDAPLLVTFNASQSSDPDGSVVSWSWDFGDGNSDTGQGTAHEFAAGDHTVTLTVTDNDGATHQYQRVIHVNAAPVPRITADVTNGQTPLTVNFDASATTDDGSIATYAWDFGNGQTDTGVIAAQEFTTGEYTVTLTVTDNDGTSASVVQVVTVTPKVFPVTKCWLTSSRAEPDAGIERDKTAGGKLRGVLNQPDADFKIRAGAVLTQAEFDTVIGFYNAGKTEEFLVDFTELDGNVYRVSFDNRPSSRYKSPGRVTMSLVASGYLEGDESSLPDGSGNSGSTGDPQPPYEPRFAMNADASVAYYGMAAPGTPETENQWRLIKVDLVNGDGDGNYPNNDKSFKYRWDQRESYVYE